MGTIPFGMEQVPCTIGTIPFGTEQAPCIRWTRPGWGLCARGWAVGRVRIATRGSRLALWQAGWVQQQLERLGAQVELVVVETQGDRESRPFAQMQGQGFFTKAVQDAVLNWEADLAVHSFKDLPSARPEGLEIAAVPKREDPRELLLVRPEALDEAAPGLPLRSGALAGTSAARRQAQLRQLRPDLGLKELRGNVPTRVDKLRCGGTTLFC